MPADRLRNYIAFAVLMFATLMRFQFLWGVLFIFWTVFNVKTGQAFLMSPVIREEDPILFWLIQAAWFGFGLLLIIDDLPFGIRSAN